MANPPSEHIVIFKCNINEVSTFKTERILILKDRTFSLEKKSGKKVLSYSWRKLTKVQLDDKILEVNFGENIYKFMALHSSEQDFLSTVLKWIIYIIRHVLTHLELKEIIYDSIEPLTPIPTFRGLLTRLKETAKIESIRISQPTLEALQKIISVPTKNFILDPYFSLIHFDASNSLSKTQYAAFILNILPYFDIDSLQISSKLFDLDTDIYQFLQECFYDKEMKFKRLEIDAPIKEPSSFISFLASLSQNRYSNIKCLSFLNTNLSKDLLKSLYVTINKMRTSLQSIEFHNAIHADSLTYFFNSLMVGPQFDGISILNFDHTSGLLLDNLFEIDLKNITHLSLVDCNIDIALFFKKYLETYVFHKLQQVNLSNNICRSPLQLINKYYLPKDLNTLIVDSVQWRNLEPILNIFQALIDCPHLFNLSMNEITFIDKDVPSELLYEHLLRKNFSKTHFDLFSWDSNFITTNFFFFLQNTSVRRLSINNDIDLKDESLLDAFSYYLNKIPENQLTYLSIAGSPQKAIRYRLDFLKTKGVKNLSFLNISNTYGLPTSLEQLRDYINSQPTDRATPL